MSASKNIQGQNQRFKDNGDARQEFCASLRPVLDMHCETIMMECFISSGNVVEAKRLTIKRLRQHFRNPANYRNPGPNNLLPGIMKTAKSLCDDYPVRWRRMAAQLRGEEEFTAQGIRSILGTLPDRQHGFVWLYIFEAVSVDAFSQVFRMSDKTTQKVLAAVKHFLRQYFSWLGGAVDAERDEAIRKSLRKILTKAINSDVSFKIETEDMLRDIFVLVGADTNSDAERKQQFDEMSADIYR